jgi:hypothetical protein
VSEREPIRRVRPQWLSFATRLRQASVRPVIASTGRRFCSVGELRARPGARRLSLDHSGESARFRILLLSHRGCADPRHDSFGSPLLLRFVLQDLLDLLHR